MFRDFESESTFAPNVPRTRMITDKEGRFHVTGLVPGLTYHFGVLEYISQQNRLGWIAKEIAAQPAEVIDLGDTRSVVE
jgi:hypothetical protein